MCIRLRHTNSNSGRLLRAPANALLLRLALGTAAALHAQQSADKPAGTYSLLYSFQCSPDGKTPESGLVQDSSGNLYGTTVNGGQYGYGTVFKMTLGGAETVLHSFAGPPSDGGYPDYGGLTLDAAGNLYGTTSGGGQFGGGTVFNVTATGTESVLYNFCSRPGCQDGGGPLGGIVRDSAGNLYGTTVTGGTDGICCSYGTVFKLTPGGTESVLHTFEFSSTDGAFPSGNLTGDPSGNLYGTTQAGGAYTVGTVFEVSANGAESLLYSFKGSPTDGALPLGGSLLRETSGNLYGVTEIGGADGTGVVFKLTPEGTESVLLDFNGTGGGAPLDGLAKDAAGNLYGTTYADGSGTSCVSYGCGVLFGLTTTGTEIVLHNFTLSSSSDGANPYGGVVRDPSGNLYGTLAYGGALGCGAVFKFTP
jgi:uncharacterized repeat protein (TIGR03803 family)